jgi:hypothetical protein
MAARRLPVGLRELAEPPLFGGPGHAVARLVIRNPPARAAAAPSNLPGWSKVKVVDLAVDRTDRFAFVCVVHEKPHFRGRFLLWSSPPSPLRGYGGQPSRGLPTVAHAARWHRERRLVRKRGFEPPLPCGNKLLRLARLPVPPLPHEEGTTAGSNFQLYRKRGQPQTASLAGPKRSAPEGPPHNHRTALVDTRRTTTRQKGRQFFGTMVASSFAGPGALVRNRSADNTI